MCSKSTLGKDQVIDSKPFSPSKAIPENSVKHKFHPSPIPLPFITNEHFIRQVSKKFFTNIYSLYMTQKVLHLSSFSKVLRFLKRIKWTKIIICDSMFRNPKQGYDILKVFYSKTSGISSAMRGMPSTPDKFSGLKTLKKFKYLKYLSLIIGNDEIQNNLPVINSQFDMKSRIKEAKELKSILTALTQLTKLSISDDYKHSHEALIKTLTFQCKSKPLLRNIYYIMTTKPPRPIQNLKHFFESLKNLEHLEAVRLYLHNSDITEENIYTLCQSLEKKESLQFLSLEIHQPNFTKYLTELSSLKPLRLDFSLRTLNADLEAMQNLMKSFKGPIALRLDQIPETYKAKDPFYLMQFFDILVSITKLTRFDFKESQHLLFSPLFRRDLMINFAYLFQNCSNSIEKMHFSFNDSQYLLIFLDSLAQNIKRFHSLKGFGIDISQYSETTNLNDRVVELLESLEKMDSLNNLNFTLRGDIDNRLSKTIVEKLTKFKKLKYLSSFQIKVNPRILMFLFGRLGALKELKLLKLWIVPLEEQDEGGFDLIKEKLFERILNCIRRMKDLIGLELRFGIEEYTVEDLIKLKVKLEINNVKLHVRIYRYSE